MIQFLFSQYKDYSSVFIFLELTAVVFGIISVLFARKNNILVYPTGLVSTLIYVYILWQASELAFQYSFFQKLLTDVYANSATPMTIAVSNTTFAYVGVVRYFLAVVFALLLARFLYLKNSEDVATKDKSGF